MKKVFVILFLVLIVISGCGRNTSTIEKSLLGHWKVHATKFTGTTLAGKIVSSDLSQNAQIDLNYYIGKDTIFIVDDKGTKSQYNYKISKSNEKENTLTLSPIIDVNNSLGVEREFAFANNKRTKATVTADLSKIKQTTQTDIANDSWSMLKPLFGATKIVITEDWTYVDDKQKI